MGKKGKGKVEFLTDKASLEPFDCEANDMINTPLGVTCTVIGVRDGALWLKWPGGIESPASPDPKKAKNKEELGVYGYHRRPQSAHIQRSIDERLRVRAAWAWALSPGRASQPTRDMGSRFFSVGVSLIGRRSTSSGATTCRARGRRRSSCPSDRMAPPAPLPLLPSVRSSAR